MLLLSETMEVVARRIADVFERDNKAFNRERFIEVIMDGRSNAS